MKKVTVYFRDESGAVLVADSSGRIVEDLQPMTLLYLSCMAEDGGRRESNGYNVAARAGMEFYTPERLEDWGRRMTLLRMTWAPDALTGMSRWAIQTSQAASRS